MPLIPYKKFAKFRLRDFYPRGTKMFRHKGAFECELGYAGCEGFAFTFCAWPEDRPNEVGQISLCFSEEDNECPPEIARKILMALNLPLRPGMTKEEVMDVLGKPTCTRQFHPKVLVLEFRCAADPKSKYMLDCGINRRLGLTSLSIVREDMYDPL